MLSISMEQVSDLISKIYDCSLQPDLWPETLEAIARSLDASYALITLADVGANPPRTLFTVTSPWDQSQIVRMNEEFGSDIPGIWSVINGDIDAPFATLSEMPEREWRASRFYREWVAPQGLRDGCVTKFTQTGQRLGLLSFATGAHRDIVSADEMAIIKFLSPHVRRAALIGDLLNRSKIAIATYRSTLDQLQSPVFLTDRTGKIEFRNAAGEILLGSRQVASSQSDSVMSLAAPSLQTHLADAIVRAACADASALGGRGIGIPLSASGGPPLVGYVLPLSNSDVRGSFDRAEVAVFVSVGNEHVAPPEAMLLGLFDLTPSEARVMLRIGAGASIAEAAEALRLSDNTVKTHLSRVYAKTNVSRQSQLATLLASLAKP